MQQYTLFKVVIRIVGKNCVLTGLTR